MSDDYGYDARDDAATNQAKALFEIAAALRALVATVRRPDDDITIVDCLENAGERNAGALNGIREVLDEAKRPR